MFPYFLKPRMIYMLGFSWTALYLLWKKSYLHHLDFCILNNFQINSFCHYVVCWELKLHYSVCNLEYSHFSHIEAWTHVYHGYWLLQRVETSSHALYIFNCSPGDRMSAYSVSEVPFFFFTLVTITLYQHDKWNIQSCSLIMCAMIILNLGAELNSS